MKLAASPRSKYSLAMLRPPVIAKLPSAIISLLCMRWLMRASWCADRATRAAKPPLRAGSGLNRRTSKRGCSESAANSASARARVEVVDQDADANAARGGVEERAQELTARAVVLDQVVLDVDRFLGASDQGQARLERLVTFGKQAKARQAGGTMRNRGVGDPAERGRRTVGDRMRCGPIDAVGKGGTAAERDGRRDGEHAEPGERAHRVVRGGGEHGEPPVNSDGAGEDDHEHRRGGEAQRGADQGGGEIFVDRLHDRLLESAGATFPV